MKYIHLLICLLFIALSGQAQSSIWYVNASASPPATGLNWGQAFPNLHQALSVAQAGDQVWVATGTYLPDTGTDRDHPFVLPSGVQLFGGFQGWEASVAQRDIIAYPTILSGDIGLAGDSTDNAYTILYLEYPDSTTLVSGFTLERGYAVSDTSYFNGSRILSGAAVYIVADDSVALPTFEHCIFRDNLAQSYGGAIYVRAVTPIGSWPTFRYCDFINNTAYGYDGGAVYMTGGNLHDRGREFEHCRFIHNRAGRRSGGIYIEKSVGAGTLDLHGCLAEANSAPFLAGFLGYLSSGITLRSILIDSCRFAKNYSEYGAPALWLISFENVKTLFVLKNSEITEHVSTLNSNYPIIFGESASDYAVDSMWAINNYFHNNKGLGICGLSSSLYAEMNKNIVSNNVYGIGANAPYCHFKNNILKNNHIGAGGASGYVENVFCNNLYYHNGNDTMAYFNLVGNYPGTLPLPENHIFNNTFIGNFYDDDHNVDLDPAYGFNLNHNNIYQNNINIYDGQVGIPMQVERDSNYFANNIMDVDCQVLSPRSICGPGNIVTSDPQFVDADMGDYHLSPCSPGVDAGGNSLPDTFNIVTDLSGAPRKINGSVDIGALESMAFALSQAPVIKAACNGLPSGSISFVIANGCPPYQVAWANGNTESLKINDLAAGIYQITITDSQGQQVAPVLEVPASSIAVVPYIQKTSSPTVADGAISLDVSGGLLPYEFAWNTGDTSPILTNLLPANYQVTVTDAGGCSFIAQYQVGFTVASHEAPDGVQVELSPNPADQTVHILSSESGSWQLYSSAGVLVKKVVVVANKSTTIGIGDLSAGVYQYVVSSSSVHTRMGTLIVAHP